MRLRTHARIRSVARARRSLVPASLAIAVLTAAGIGAGATGAMAAPQPSVPEPAALVAPAVTQGATAERPVDQDAAFYVSVAHAVRQSATGKVDTTGLDAQITALDDSSTLPERSVRVLTRLVQESSLTVTAAVADYDAQVAAKAAADAAAARAAEAAAAEALAQANTPEGAKATARSMAASQYGWGDDQFSCLESLWQKESSWNYQAYNADGGATGIPQALPGSKMASAGSDWQTSATTQIAWGLGYIAGSYGTPCSAWGHSQSYNWY